MKASELLSLLALLFSLIAFYATTLRRGRLHIMDGPSYALAMTADEATLYLSLTFANTGSRDWPVRNLRVVADALSHRPLTFKATHQAMPGDDPTSERAFAHGFLVPARSTVSGIYEFISGDPVRPWKPAQFEITLLIQPGRSGQKYVFAGRYPIKVDTSFDHSRLITHENADEPDGGAASRRMPRSLRNRLARLAEPD